MIYGQTVEQINRPNILLGLGGMYYGVLAFTALGILMFFSVRSFSVTSRCRHQGQEMCIVLTDLTKDNRSRCFKHVYVLGTIL